MITKGAMGCGVVYYDMVFDMSRKHAVFLGGRAGGSTANFLSNYSKLGGHARLVGAAGGDIFGVAARRDLISSQVNTDDFRLIQGKGTRIIFEKLGRSEELDIGIDKHTFSVTCPVCSRGEPKNLLCSIQSGQIEYPISGNLGSFAYVDSVSTAKARWFDDLKSHANTFVVADIGRIGSLRYFSNIELSSMLKRLDGMYCSRLVASTLMTRLCCQNLSDILKHLDLRFLVVSDGPNGVVCVFKSINSQLKIVNMPAPQVSVVDAAGAGDAFFAGFMYCLDGNSHLDHSPSGFESRLIEESLKSGTELASKALRGVGARGHLETTGTPGLEDFSVLPRQCGLETDAILKSIDSGSGCPFCCREDATPSKSSKKKSMKVYLRNINGLVARMDSVTRTLQQKSTSFDEFRNFKTAIAIGTGGSYPVAHFIAHAMSRQSAGLISVMRPMEYVRLPRKCDLAFIISYSGRTADCVAAMKQAIRVGVAKVIVVSGRSDGELGKLLRLSDLMIDYEHGSLEKGFLSIRGTVLPCAWFLSASIGPDAYFRFLQWIYESCALNPSATFGKFADLVKRRSKKGDEFYFDLYGTGYAVPALWDFESKITEAGLGYVRVHESKDFSHGRFMAVMGGSQVRRERSIGLLFSLGTIGGYERKLLKTIEKYQDVVLIESKYENIEGGLELLVIIQFLVRVVGEVIGRDLSRPGEIPKAGLDLYRWKGKLDQ